MVLNTSENKPQTKSVVINRPKTIRSKIKTVQKSLSDVPTCVRESCESILIEEQKIVREIEDSRQESRKAKKE